MGTGTIKHGVFTTKLAVFPLASPAHDIAGKHPQQRLHICNRAGFEHCLNFIFHLHFKSYSNHRLYANIVAANLYKLNVC